MTIHQFNLLADDLTGALDAGMALCGMGTTPKVLWDIKHLDKLNDHNTLIFDSESRNTLSEKAKDIVTSFNEHIGLLGIPLGYKKIDSTWRGNTSLELVTTQKLMNVPMLIVPALPSQYRITKGGCIMVEGLPLQETDFGRDPFGGMKDSAIPRLLAPFTDDTIACLSPHDLPSLQSAIENGTRWLIGDAESEHDLNYWAQVALQYHVLPCGSAGLFGAILRRLVPNPNPYTPVFGAPEQLLLINGSPSQRTREQIDHLSQHSPMLTQITLDPQSLFSDSFDIEIQRVIMLAEDSLKVGKPTLIDGASTPREKLLPAVGGNTEKLAAQSKQLQSSLVRITSALLKPSHAILIGGDTASAVLTGQQAFGLEIMCPILPQIPLSRILGGGWNETHVITKAGGFGSRDALTTILKILYKK